MYCPNCGAQIVPNQNFCRSCGSVLRSVMPNAPNYPPTWMAPSSRWQILFDAVLEALRTGFEFAFRQPTAPLEGESRSGRFGRWGLIVFWLGLAALISDFMGFIFVVAGVALMAYARGFFGPVEDSGPLHAPEFQRPPARETIYTPPPHPSAMNTERADYAPPSAEAHPDV